jgi:peroxin-5
MGINNHLTFNTERENPYASENASSMTRSYLDEAKSLLSGGGSLTEAALLLEAAIQKGETGQGGFEAWLLLGECRSMDEREEQAMQALAEGVRVAEEGGTPGAGMMVRARCWLLLGRN